MSNFNPDSQENLFDSRAFKFPEKKKSFIFNERITRLGWTLNSNVHLVKELKLKK